MRRIMFHGGGMPMMPSMMCHYNGGWNRPIFMTKPMFYAGAGFAAGVAATGGGLEKLGRTIKNSGIYKTAARGVNNFWKNYGGPVFNGLGNLIKFCWDNTLGRVFSWMGNLGKKKA